MKAGYKCPGCGHCFAGKFYVTMRCGFCGTECYEYRVRYSYRHEQATRDEKVARDKLDIETRRANEQEALKPS